VIAERLPRSWNAALDQLRRDVNVLGRRALGHGPSPLVPRLPRRSPTTSGARGEERRRTNQPRGARELDVACVVRETAGAFTIVLREQDASPFDFQPGQFFTVRAMIDGEAVTRNYSASNAPGTTELHLTIKEKPGGRVSPVLSRVQPGDRLCVLGPFGSFVVDAAHDPVAHGPRRLVLVAGGGGITPLASIARTLLAREPSAEIALLYANRSREDAILGAELDALVVAHGSRFSVLHHLGPLDRAAASLALDALPLASHASTRFFVCGPDGMRDEVLASLAARGIDRGAIAIERFSVGPRPQVATSSAAIAAAAAPGARSIALRVGKGSTQITHRTSALPGATVLEAGLAAGAPMPFSCAVGGCGACKVRLVEGNVEVEEPSCLTEAERAAGYVLACVGRPCGPCVVEIIEEGGA
jgi:ferredoxin-NADP reductase